MVAALKEHLTAQRVERINTVLSHRTRKVCLVLEDIRQEHNIGALLRTADILGVQDVHLISQKYEAKLAKAISKGSTNWITLHRYQERHQDNLQLCLNELKEQGYQLVVADPDGEVELSELEFTGDPMALLMGSEWEGVSHQAKAEATHKVRIPQFGFTQSYNVSVAAALLLHQLTMSLRKSGVNWGLSEVEKLDLELDWIMKRLGDSGGPLKRKIEEDWLKRKE